MQNILIPTNFSVQSLACVPALCEQHKDSALRLVFIHMFKISDSISDLLMLSRRNKEYSYISDDFYAQCETLRQRYGQLIIKIDFFYGSSLVNFRDFLEMNEIDVILDPSSCELGKLNRSSTDPMLFIGKSRIPFLSVVPQQKIPVAGLKKEQLVLEEELMAG
ncbi:MAG TPA: hypothetical protein VKB19_06825 [Pedobacter sp.]|nr:hypothetical protein [Pedobacter sp.]